MRIRQFSQSWTENLSCSRVEQIPGAAVSTDEIVALVTVAGAGIGLPANIAVAAAAIGGEAILLLRFQLQLVANLGKLYGAELDPEDPEDVLMIVAYAIGGSAVEGIGRVGGKAAANAAGRAAKIIFAKDRLAVVQKIGRLFGMKILQRGIVKNAVPIVSLVVGSGWNYFSTKAVGRVAIKHFKQRIADSGTETAGASAHADVPSDDEGEVDRGVVPPVVEAVTETHTEPV